MPAPEEFSWIERPLLAAMACPGSLEEYQWLRTQGIQLILSLMETPPPRAWINEAGLFSTHVPIEDMHPPTQQQIDTCLNVIKKAHAKKIGVGLHCTAGLGRTGTLLACWFVDHEGMSGRDAVARIRRLRPGSVETDEQVEAVTEFARRRKMQAESDVP
jgi:atypical dual specificity phosphatase